MPSATPRKIELLAPARDINIACKAIACGADAIYIGPSSHGARAAAGNSIDDIARLVETAHPYGVRVYATVNTIVYDNEIKSVEKLITDLYHAGVDALIVQDMGILRMDIPPIDLHASTQCDIRSVDKARFLSSAGFSRVVLARELSAEEISRIHREVDVELEAFIHGALCVSYSGDCRASFAATGRSANRGECAQICRLKFDLTDGKGNILAPARHYLSLRDLNRLDDVGTLIDAGASSLKIEGRLKDASYVMNTVAAYRKRIDEIIAESEGRYIRSSFGISSAGFKPDLEKSFNRGFTSYFFNQPDRNTRMASLATPKMTGIPVGKVIKTERGVITADLKDKIANGDGLGYFTPEGIFKGFRVNRAEGKRLFPASPVNPAAGTQLFRNRDKAFDDMINAAEPSRRVSVDFKLRHVLGSVILSAVDERGLSATAVLHVDDLQPAKTQQHESRRKVLSKLGDTIYALGKLDDRLGEIFLPASQLTSLRRDVITALENTARATYKFRYRIKERYDIALPTERISFHDNVSNRLAREFYLSHGAKEITPALETEKNSRDGMHVMTTRYCIRRELGACLRSPAASKLPSDLYLESPGIRLKLCPDCSKCMMNIYYSKLK
ncbi:MAG: U32 family peptidase [Duncaniella sp.]|nr:U32 family peptidase [Duncaniella sp.]